MQAAVRETRATLRHLVFEEYRAAAALRLGAIHGEIGVADDFLEIHAVVRKQRDADAGAHLVLAAAEARGQRERADHALGDLARGLRIADVSQQHREFIAAEASHGVALFRAGLERCATIDSS
jgi:hypothetical protein